MGIVAKQASRNAVSILIGTICGALNTIVVLPQAFEGFEEGWGLLKVITAYALIFSQFFHGGIPNAIIRFFPRLSDDDQPRFLRFAFSIPLVGTAILGVILLFFGGDAITLVNAQNAELLSGNFSTLFILSAFLIAFFSLNGYVSAILKTTFFQFLNETFLKAWYLLVALGFLFDLYTFDKLLLLYISGYGIATLTLFIYALRHGFKFKSGKAGIDAREFASYSFYSILDRGAGIVVNNLDIIMIGILIGLDEVAFYTLAFYIGSVAMIPQKSVMAIANPLTSKAIADENTEELNRIYRLSSSLQLFFGGLIFLGVWVSIDEVMELLPNQYAGGKFVVLYIGLSRLFNMATGVSGGMLVYSKHFRLNFRLNLVLILLTACTNYFFVHREFLNMGIEGAAIATALTFFIYNLAKVIFVKKHFDMTPFSRAFGWVVILIVVLSSLYWWHPFSNHPFEAILVKSSTAVAALLVAAYALKLAPEAIEILRGTRK